MRVRAAASLLFWALASVGCDPIQDRLAVRRTEDGSIEFLYACPDALDSATLRESNDRGGGDVLWKVIRDAPTEPVRVYEVGSIPIGFRQEMALTQVPGIETVLELEVDARVVDYQEFRLEQLRTDLWFHRDGLVTEEELLDEATC